jgi:hypothetical protein
MAASTRRAMWTRFYLDTIEIPLPMPDLRLPLIPRTSSAQDALQLMRARSISGIMAYDPGPRFWLYTAADLVVALATDPDIGLTDIRVARPLKLKPGQEVRLRRTMFPALPRPGTEPRRRRLPRLPIEFSVASLVIDASIIPLLEASPLDCYCKEDGKPVVDGKQGGDCPDGHRGSVRCV